MALIKTSLHLQASRFFYKRQTGRDLSAKVVRNVFQIYAV